jgi:hypothetical protein
MRVPHDEEVANHVSPESCGGYGNISAEALIGENTGGLLSSEITTIQVPTLWSEGEGNIRHNAMRELCRDLAESGNLACVEAFCTGIGRSVNPPVFKNWNRRLQHRKISWCDGLHPLPSQAWNTKSGCKYRVGLGRSESVRQPHNVSRKSDNNIVPEKQANKGNISPRRSLRREGR